MSRREAYFDNAKFLIGALVVAGHAFDPITLPHGFETAEIVGTAFRMPVFAFLVGHFSRGFLRSTGRARRLVAKVVIAYLLFDLLYRLLEWRLTGGAFAFNPLDPYDHLWFLVAMLVWRGTAPLWPQLRHPFAVSVFVSLTSGLVELEAFTRILSMLPFFVLGLTLERRHLAALRERPAHRIAGAAVLTAAYAAFFFLVPRYISGKGVLNNAWVASYAESGLAAPVGMGARLFFMAAALVLGAAVLALIPARAGRISVLGGRSLYMYVLHYAFIQLGRHFGWFEPLPEGWLGASLVVVLSFVLGAVLCSRPTYLLFRRLMEPPTDWLFAPRRPAEDRPASSG